MARVIKLDEDGKPKPGKSRVILNYVILILSLINIYQMVGVLIYNFGFNAILSILLSFVGIAAFWATYKEKQIADRLTLLWIVPQFIIFINFPSFAFDVTQGYSLPLGIKYWTKSNGEITSLFNLSFNFLALIFYIAYRSGKRG